MVSRRARYHLVIYYANARTRRYDRLCRPLTADRIVYLGCRFLRQHRRRVDWPTDGQVTGSLGTFSP